MKRLFATLCLVFALVAPCVGQAVFVPAPVTQKTTTQRVAQAWPAGVLIFDSTASTLWVGDGTTTGGIPAKVGTITGAITESQVTNLVSDLALKAALASPAFSGTPTAPTAAPGTNTTQIATTAFVLANASSGLSIGESISGGTAGRVLFEGFGPVVSDSAALTFNVNEGTLTLAANAGGLVTPSVGIGADSTTGFYSIATGTISAKSSGVAKWIAMANTGGGTYTQSLRLRDTMMLGWAGGNPEALAEDVGIVRAATGVLRVVGDAAATTEGALLVGAPSAATVGLTVQGTTSQSADLAQYKDVSGNVLTRVYAGGALQLPHLADAAAPNDSWYFSTDSSKASYKDAGGTAHPLY